MSDTSTRSGLLWEVERILTELHETGKQIDCLVMENVPAVHQQGNYQDFEKWQIRLEELGYESYWWDLNSKNYGIPQNRERCFMVSVPKGYNVSKPVERKLDTLLCDLLDKNVDEKYYLSEKMISYISAKGGGGMPTKIQKSTYQLQDHSQPSKTKEQEQQITCQVNFPNNYDLDKIKGTENRAELLLLLSQNGEIENNGLPNGCDSSINNPKIRPISNTITARYDAGIQNQAQIGMCVVEEINNKKVDVIGNYSPSGHNASRVIDPEGISPTVMENHGTITAIAIKNATKQGYLEAEIGDGVDISSRMNKHRGTVQKGLSQTITTMGGANVGVVVKNEEKNEK